MLCCYVETDTSESNNSFLPILFTSAVEGSAPHPATETTGAFAEACLSQYPSEAVPSERGISTCFLFHQGMQGAHPHDLYTVGMLAKALFLWSIK